MSAKLLDLTSIDQLSEVLTQSNQKTQLIFKHSNACPISADAYDELYKYLNSSPSDNVGYNLIVVQTARPVSNEVETRLSVVHESPQAILVRDGKVLWHTSHRKITQLSLANAINNN
ncbi:MAG: bacillithiol system redox-active protein YtxJ [Blastocatellia bacterium]|nr:bacillithiol system redox-active protein YtxJ [Blastocatellia bacterium]MBN8724436.1 bacillithiol system redox-active protein YtxJ [Acidobacteriota bacterium]